MAKKKSSSVTHPPSKPAQPPRKEKHPIAVAEAVAARVQIQNILARSFHASRQPEVPGPDAAHVKVRIAQIEISRSNENETFSVFLNFELTLHSQRGDESDEESAASIACGFVLLYSLSGIRETQDEELLAFGKTSAVFNAWPYWREFVQSACSRLALPPILISTHRASSS